MNTEQNTAGFSEPLYEVLNRRNGNVLVVVGARNREMALWRAKEVDHLVDLPPYEELDARFMLSGPIRGVPYFSEKYFLWRDSLPESAYEYEVEELDEDVLARILALTSSAN